MGMSAFISCPEFAIDMVGAVMKDALCHSSTMGLFLQAMGYF